MPRMNTLPKKMMGVMKECTELGMRKNNDYSGAKKIDNIAMTGVEGISVRLLDKVSRLYSLTKVESQVKDESVEDTLKDIINYAGYGVLLLRGKWGDEEKK